MRYLDFPVNGQAGDRVIVELDHQANVRLVDELNFGLFKRNQTHLRFGGGWATRSPVQLALPRSGSFHVVVDDAGRGGAIRAEVQLLRPRS
jgi:hypothetical protein